MKAEIVPNNKKSVNEEVIADQASQAVQDAGVVQKPEKSEVVIDRETAEEVDRKFGHLKES